MPPHKLLHVLQYAPYKVHFPRKVNTVLEKLIHLRLHVEAAIDFPEEEIDFLADGKILSFAG